MKKNINYRKILFVLGFLLSFLLFVTPMVKNYAISNNSNKYNINKVNYKKIIKNKRKKASYDWSKVGPISPEIILKSAKNDLPVIGAISIPDLDVNLPIFKGITDETISFGAGTLKEDQVMGEGNYPLASHHVYEILNSENLLFSPLTRAKNGQTIYLTDKKTVYQYVIDNIFIVNPDQVDVIDDVPNKKIVTLITCTDSVASQRIIVQGSLVAIYNSNDAPKEAIDSFQKEYKTM